MWSAKRQDYSTRLLEQSRGSPPKNGTARGRSPKYLLRNPSKNSPKTSKNSSGLEYFEIELYYGHKESRGSVELWWGPPFCGVTFLEPRGCLLARFTMKRKLEASSLKIGASSAWPGFPVAVKLLVVFVGHFAMSGDKDTL